MRFELIRSRIPRRQRWRWRIVANNGQVLAWSEAYSNRADAEQAIANVRDHAATAPTRSTP